MAAPSKSERAYRLRAKGVSWAEVATRVLPEVADVVSARKSLSRGTKRWALARGMAWPPVPGQKVPELTICQQRLRDRWAQEYEAGRDPAIRLTDGARRWARDNGFPWPPPERQRARRSRLEACYLLKAEGKSWEEIRILTKYKGDHIVIEAARKWAHANDLPWPLPGMRGG